MSSSSCPGLPSNPYISNKELWHNAYQHCLTSERCYQDVSEARPPKAGVTPLVAARFLGYMIIEAPTSEGRDALSNAILNCVEDDALLELANQWVDRFIHCFGTACRGYTPLQSRHPERLQHEEKPSEEVPSRPRRDHISKEKALYRDRYRCVITGRVDQSKLEIVPALQVEFEQNPSLTLDATEAYHILPEIIAEIVLEEHTGGEVKVPSALEHHCATALLAVIRQFGGLTLPGKRDNDSFPHALANIMTLTPGIRQLLNSLKLWFEPRDTPNKYTLCATNSLFLRGLPSTVTLKTPDASEYPLPSPQYLNLHAICARIIYRSGAGEYVDSVLKDMESLRVLADDGSSADALHHALTQLSTSLVH